ncbi:hypothetical protein GIB67_024700, partial [Kingdonia uniflora]
RLHCKFRASTGHGRRTLFSSLEDLQYSRSWDEARKGSIFSETTGSRPLALKVISREELMKKKNGKSRELVLKQVLLERDFLKMFDHPLLPKFRGEIVTDVMVGLAIDYCPVEICVLFGATDGEYVLLR